MSLSSTLELKEAVRDASSARKNGNGRPVIRLVVSRPPPRPIAVSLAPAEREAPVANPDAPMPAPNMGSESIEDLKSLSSSTNARNEPNASGSLPNVPMPTAEVATDRKVPASNPDVHIQGRDGRDDPVVSMSTAKAPVRHGDAVTVRNEGETCRTRKGFKRNAPHLKPTPPTRERRENTLLHRFDVHQGIRCSSCSNEPIYGPHHRFLGLPTFDLCSQCFRNSTIDKREQMFREYRYPWEPSVGDKEVPGAPLSFGDTGEQVHFRQNLMTDLGIIQPRHKYTRFGRPMKHYYLSVGHYDECTADFVRDLRKLGGLDLHDGDAVYDQEAAHKLLIMVLEHRRRRW